LLLLKTRRRKIEERIKSGSGSRVPHIKQGHLF
jgi:hypothetical protein